MAKRRERRKAKAADDRPDRFHRAELAVLLAAGAVKLIALWQLGGHPLLQPVEGLDSAWYVALARRVAGGDLTLGPNVYFVSPLYIYFLGAVFALTGGSLAAARLTQVALGVLAVWWGMRTARLWFGPAAAAVAGSLLTLAGVVTFHEVLLLQSALDPILTAGFSLALARAWTMGSRGTWTAAGAAGALLTLNRPNALMVLAGVLVLPLIPRLRPEPPRGRFRASLAFALGAAVTLAPVALRNLAVSGELALVSSHGGLNFYIGNHTGADGTYHAPPGITPSIEGQARDARLVAERARGRPLSDGEVSRYFVDEALAWMRAHPVDALALTGRKVLLLLNRATVALNYSYPYYAYDERTILRFLPIGAWCLIPLGIAGLFLAPRGQPRPAFLGWAMLVPLYAASVVVFFVSERYRLPLLVPLSVTASGALLAIANVARIRARIPVAVPVALAVLSVAAFWPVEADDGRMEERVAMAVAMAAEGRTGDAVSLAGRVAREHPMPGTVHYRVGRALQERGDLRPAEQELRRALAIDPDQPEIHFSLADVLIALGRPRDARPHMLRAASAGPRMGEAMRWLVEAAASEADRDEAARLAQEIARVSGLSAAELDSAGRVLLGRRRGDLAVPFYSALETRFPGVAAIAEGLGLGLLLQDDAAGARAALERAAQADPNQPSVLLNLAVVRTQLGDFTGARAAVSRALELKPDYEQAKALELTLRAYPSRK
ncbi:MAG TPA: tetratricopeptide repeat protein [Vicinamibacterales bacterium]